MLNKELLLMSGGMQADFPPNLEEYIVPGFVSMALTVNQGAGTLNTDKFTVRNLSIYNGDGDSVYDMADAHFTILPDSDMSILLLYTQYDPNHSDNFTFSFEMFLPSENEIFTTYDVAGVYVEPSKDSTNGWWIEYDYDNASRRLIFLIHSVTQNKPYPDYIGLVLDLKV